MIKLQLFKMTGKLPMLDRKAKSSVSSFQQSMKVTLIFGQIFALIPVYGITSNNVTHVKYNRRSLKYLYAIVSLLGQVFVTGLMIRKFLVIDTALPSLNGLVFYSSTLITMIMFMQIGKKWPVLVRYICKVEELDPIIGSHLRYKCNITCVVLLTLSLVEHLLAIVSGAIRSETCEPIIILDTYEKLVRSVYDWVFSIIPYHVVLGFICQFLQVQATFTWNFADLFVICMSYYLTARFEQINNKLKLARGKSLPETFWRSAREEYSRAAKLVRKVDEVISGIVFISFANNLFFICLQLYYTLENGLRGKKDCKRASGEMTVGPPTTVIYFAFSLAYLIGRSVSVQLIASDVHTSSTEPSAILYEVPSSCYCVEVQRFLTQVNEGRITVTGMKFFSITRGLLLTIAGTIVTYELVMFQMNSSSPHKITITTASSFTSDYFDNTTEFTSYV